MLLSTIMLTMNQLPIDLLRRQHKVDTTSPQTKQENQYLSRRHVSTHRGNDQVHSPAENQVTHENPVPSPTLNDKKRKRKGVLVLTNPIHLWLLLADDGRYLLDSSPSAIATNIKAFRLFPSGTRMSR